MSYWKKEPLLAVTVPERQHGVGHRCFVPGGPLWILKDVLCASFLIEFEERSQKDLLEITCCITRDVTLYYHGSAFAGDYETLMGGDRGKVQHPLITNSVLVAAQLWTQREG